jgi:hypothetical protein
LLNPLTSKTFSDEEIVLKEILDDKHAKNCNEEDEYI